MASENDPYNSYNLLKTRPSTPKHQQSSLGAFFFQYSLLYREQNCLINATNDKSFSYGSIHQHAVIIAMEFQKRKMLNNDDFVLIYSKYHCYTTPAILAALYLGAKICFLREFNGNLDKITETVHKLQPRIFFVECDDLIDVFRIDEFNKKENALSNKVCVINIHNEGYYTLYGPFNFLNLEIDKAELTGFLPCNVSVHDTACIFYTRRTSKPVIATHYGLLYKTNLMLNVVGINTKRVIHGNPLSCVTSFIQFLTTYKTGGLRVIYESMTPDMFINVIISLKVTYADTGDIDLNKVDDGVHTEPYLSRNLESINLSGGHVTKYQFNTFRKVFPCTRIFVSYKVTEALGYVSMQPHYTHSGIMLSVVGSTSAYIGLKPYFDQVQHYNQTAGEIWLKCPNGSKFYHDDSITIPWTGDCSLFKTGDYGCLDELGQICVINKLDELFMIGFNLTAPAILEGKIEETMPVKKAVIINLANCDNPNPDNIIIAVGLWHNIQNEAVINQFNITLSDIMKSDPSNWIVRWINDVPKRVDGTIDRVKLSNELILSHRIL